MTFDGKGGAGTGLRSMVWWVAGLLGGVRAVAMVEYGCALVWYERLLRGTGYIHLGRLFWLRSLACLSFDICCTTYLLLAYHHYRSYKL